MKTNFSNAELPHAWRHRRSPHGKSNSMSFDGDTLYSYSTAIARRIHHKGREAYVIDGASFSVTTAHHQSSVRQAMAPEDTVFLINNGRRGQSLDVTGQDLFNGYRQKAADAYQASLAPRLRQSTRDRHLAESQRLASEANRAAQWCGLRCRVRNVASVAAQIKAAEKRQAKRDEAVQKRRDEEAKAHLEECLAKWHALETNHLPYTPGTYLRALPSGDVETSRGIIIPRDEARLAIAFCQRHRAAGWRRNGESYQIAGYHLDHVGPHTVKAGCHVIAWSEIEALLPALGM